MSYGRLLNQAPPTLRKLFRDKEHLNQKIINRKWSAIFNKKCLLENIVPNFSNIFMFNNDQFLESKLVESQKC